MAQASHNQRKLRRIKRELSLTRKMLELVMNQRDQARMIAATLEQELKKKDLSDIPMEPEGQMAGDELTPQDIG